MPTSQPDPVDRSRFDAILFDLDGVLTETASLHAAAWKQMFDEYLHSRAQVLDEDFVEFSHDDYLQCVDGRPRFDGVRTFLASRGIEVPEGTPDDPPVSETIGGLGNRKNEAFLRLIDDGVTAFPGAAEFVARARAAGMKTAVVSSSANAERVLTAAGLTDLFDTRVDGITARRLGLAGKPSPDTYLAAARRVGAPPDRAVVVEDALSGVDAGINGGFGLVIGIGSGDDAAQLLAHGAQIVVPSLGALVPD